MPSVNFYLEQPYNEGRNKQERETNQQIIKTLKKEKKAIPANLLNPNETAIYLFVRDTGEKTIKLNTGRRIHPKYWTGNKDAPVRSTYTGSIELNKYLRDLKNDTFSLIDDSRKGKKTVSFADLEVEIQKLILQLPDIEHQVTLLTLLNWFIDGDEELGIIPNPKGLSESTLKKYRKTRDLIKEFSSKKKQSIDLLDINYAWWSKFKAYLMATGNYLNQSANKILEKIKALLEYAITSYSQEMGGLIDEEICQKLAVNLKRFDLFDFSEKNRVKPEEEEMEFLRNLDLSSEPRLERVVDIFIFTAWSGPRCSNLKELKPLHANLKENTLRYKAIKTKDQADTEVPLNDIAVGILKKYWGKQKTLLPIIAGNNLNAYFQEVLEVCAEFNEIGSKEQTFDNRIDALKAWPNYNRFCKWVDGEEKILDPIKLEMLLKQTGGFNQTVEIKERRDRSMEITYVKRYKLLTIHTMRHFYGTFLVNNGLSLEEVGALLAITPETAKVYGKTKNQRAAEKARLIFQKPL